MKLTSSILCLLLLAKVGFTNQNIAVRKELSTQIKTQLDAFDKLVSDGLSALNNAFNSKQLNYL